MTDYGTIKIPREDFERHNERRQELGVTWTEYLDGHAGVDGDAVTDEINDLKNMIDTLAFDGGVLDDEAEEIMGRLDDLEARLPRKVAEELEGQR